MSAYRFAFFGIATSIALLTNPVRADDASDASNGPDVIVSSIEGPYNLACTVPHSNPPIYQACTDPIDGTKIDAIAVGTRSCNLGTAPLSWDPFSTLHPVIRSGMFRLKNDRFEQIGTSWVKHGFFATNETLGTCQSSCLLDVGGYELNPGCTDAYEAVLNAGWSEIGPASAVNAFTGTNPGPGTGYPGVSPVDARLQIHYSDLDPSLNAGALYFVDGHYVTADDAAAGNADNNVSYRQALVSYNAAQDTYNVTVTNTTVDQEPAINAWQSADPQVQISKARVPGEGLFLVAARATNIGATFWHYEYAIENINSDRSGGSFTIPLPPQAVVQNIGFHDVDYHSGEPYSRADWTVSLANNEITWSTVPYAQNQNANALRWSTLYNFRFDVNVAPDATTAILGLFKPGLPATVNVQTQGPTLGGCPDCNHNGRCDSCDIDCNSQPSCPPPCGFSDDCDQNQIPDECEEDCNHNGIADLCDIRDCPPDDPSCADCNHNTVPDGCEPDCNHDGYPDDCVPVGDCDGDGVDDCHDLCPCTTPPGACDLPDQVTCRFSNGLCQGNFPFQQCISQGGTAVCGDQSLPCALLTPCIVYACRDGCLIGDHDSDGDLDLFDAAGLQLCFSGDKNGPGFVATSPDCLTHYDFDSDGDVDNADAAAFFARFGGP